MKDERKELMRGIVTTAHNAITGTATSSAIDMQGFNGIMIYFTTDMARNWTISLTGSDSSTGTFAAVYEQANTGTMAAMSYQTNANRVFVFKGVPNYVKVVATEDADGATVTVKAQPIKL